MRKTKIRLALAGLELEGSGCGFGDYYAVVIVFATQSCRDCWSTLL